MKSLFADPEVSILAIADHRRRVTRLAAPEPEGAPLKRRWPLKITGEKVQTFTTERDKDGKIIKDQTAGISSQRRRRPTVARSPL
jgi:hypothetical protein